MRILIIPDVHGRDFWIEPCSHIDDYDKIIFLGDYHDPYPEEVSKTVSRHRLRDNLVPFVEAHKDKVICLMGNHDLQYLMKHPISRFDYYHNDEIDSYLRRLGLQMVYRVDNYLFSHAGVLPVWLEHNNLKLEELNSYNIGHPAFMDISEFRGGELGEIGSCVWGDVREYAFAAHFKDIYQIFGHTQLTGPFIEKDFACLDCRQAFVLDTETKQLTPYSVESKND